MMSALTPEEKFRVLIEDLGKPTMRGVRRCPKCGTLNGTRGISCKNKNCDVVFKEREKKGGHSADSVKIITGSTVQVYSVRLRDRGPDYRGFVQLPLVQDLDGNPAENVDPIVLESAGRCYVDTCARASKSAQECCSHIKSAVGCAEEATPLTLKNSVLNSLQVPSEVKQDIWLLATETSGPLVQRVTKNIMVVKCKSNNKYPLGFLHFAFFETSRNRSYPEHKFQCSCRVFKQKGSIASQTRKEENARRCVHFYACVCAFASDEKLAEEFAFYINLAPPVPTSCSVETALIVPTVAMEAAIAADEDHFEVTDVDTIITESQETTLTSDSIAKITTIAEDETNIEVIQVDEETILAFQPEVKRLKSEEHELLLGTDALAQASSALLSTHEHVLETVTTQPVATTNQSILSSISAAITPTIRKAAAAKTTPSKTNPTPKKSVLDECLCDLTYHQWLASVTERINQTMHYQFDGFPDPLVFHSPQKFFDCLQHRISSGSKKKRLPNFTTTFERRDALPLGKFTKYTWYITSIFHVMQIFDTPQMPLEITRSFVQNRDGTYDLYVTPKVGDSNDQSLGVGKMPIRPFELKTYLKVGMTSPDQKDPTPFIIEWIPDILPKSHIGELRIKFEYGHQRNGMLEQRTIQPVTTGEIELQTIEIQPSI